jgi:hypothetical protein
LSRAKQAVLTWLGLPRITNAAMKGLASLAAAKTRAAEVAPPTASVRPHVSHEEIPMSTHADKRHSTSVLSAQPSFPRPDKAERDTQMSRRRALRAAIKRLLRGGQDTLRHDQMMCVLNNRDAGDIPQEECDGRWVAFANELGLDE